MSAREEHFAEYFRQQRLQKRQADLLNTKEQLSEVLNRPTWWKKVKNYWRENDDKLNNRIYRTAAGNQKNIQCSYNLASSVKAKPVSYDGSRVKTAVSSATKKALGVPKLSGSLQDVAKSLAKEFGKWVIKAVVGYIGGGTVLLIVLAIVVISTLMLLLADELGIADLI